MDSMNFGVGHGVVDGKKVLEGFTSHTAGGLDKVLDQIRAAQLTLLDSVAPVNITAWLSPEPLTYSQRMEGQQTNLAIGDKWGGLFDCAWMRFSVLECPAAAPSGSSKTLVMLLDVNGEMAVVDGNGSPIRGLTSLTSEFDLSLGKPGKRFLPLPDAEPGAAIEVWADCGCNDLFGNLQENGTIREASLAYFDSQLQALYFDFEVLLDFLKILPHQSARARQLLVALSSAAKALQPDPRASGASDAARSLLAPHLAKRGGDPELQISACGHAHMDLAWLWPIRETMRKTARTFATVLANMERYPDYVFGSSQPQQLLWIKEQHPDLFSRIKQRVVEGRWDCQGAMWVEPDTNLPGGESLVRQNLLGRAFWRNEFGKDVTNMWEPDVFGYSAALPQILKRSGVHFMMTQKLSWNTVNFFPCVHHNDLIII